MKKFKSNIGKNLIQIPENVVILQNTTHIIIKSQDKILSIPKSDAFNLEIRENKLSILPTDKLSHNAYWGTYRNLLQEMITGVTSGFQQNLELFGIGYKGNVSDNVLKLKPGTSHDLIFPIPNHCKIKFITSTLMTVSGTNNQLVRETAVQIHNLRKPDAYKGKGIRIAGKEVRLKEGKKQK